MNEKYTVAKLSTVNRLFKYAWRVHWQQDQYMKSGWAMEVWKYWHGHLEARFGRGKKMTNLPIYTVQIGNLAAQEFESMNAAIDYAARHVYLAPRHLDMLEAALRGGQEYTYEYGFKAVTLSASAKEIPKDLVAAAPELLEALRSLHRFVHDQVGMGLVPESIDSAVCAAIAKAEGK